MSLENSKTLKKSEENAWAAIFKNAGYISSCRLLYLLFFFFYFSPFFLKAKELSSEHFINGEGAILQLKIIQFFHQNLK